MHKPLNKFIFSSLLLPSLFTAFLGTDTFAETFPAIESNLPIPSTVALEPAASQPLDTSLEVSADGLNKKTMELEFMPQVSIFNANSLSVQTKDYVANYGSAMEGLPIFHAVLAASVGQAGNFRFLVNTHIGMGTLERPFPIVFKNEPDIRHIDRVRLVWIPLSLSSEVRYSVPGIPFFQPSLTVGAGGHLLLQRNSSRINDRDFWIPHLFIRPALTFFDASTSAHWFGGFLFGVTLYQSLGSENELRGTSFDLSLKFLL